MTKDCFHSCSILGAYFAANPLRDAALVFHGPGGCLKMALYGACAHDLLGFERGRVALSEMSGPEAIHGGADKLRGVIRALRRRSPCARVLVIGSCASEIVGEDLEAVARDFPAGAVTILGGAGFRGDLWAGVGTALERIAQGLCTEAAGAAPSRRLVNIVGYVCDRLEHDHLANLRVLRGMLDGIGLGLNAVFVGPGDVCGLRRAWAARFNAAFAYGLPAARCLSGRYGQTTVPVDYPVGLGATAAFLRRLGRAAGRARAAEAYIDAQLRLVVPRIQAVRPALLGKRVGVSAESQKLPGLVELLLDLGLRPAWIRVTDRREAVLPRLRRLLGAGRARFDPPPDGTDGVDLIVGSSVDKYRAAGRVPVYEYTYPCFDRHCLTPEPDLGFEGAVRLAGNLANLLTRANTRAWGLSRELSRLGLEGSLYEAGRRRR